MDKPSSQLNLEDKIKLAAHKLQINNDLHNIEYTLENRTYGAVANLVYKMLNQLEKFQPNLSHEETNEMFKNFAQRKKAILKKMAEKLIVQNNLKRKRETESIEEVPDLELSTDAIDLSLAVSQASPDRPLDLADSAVERAPVYTINASWYEYRRRPVLWHCPDYSQQSIDLDEDESSFESSLEGNMFEETESDVSKSSSQSHDESFENACWYENRRRPVLWKHRDYSQQANDLEEQYLEYLEDESSFEISIEGSMFEESKSDYSQSSSLSHVEIRKNASSLRQEDSRNFDKPSLAVMPQKICQPISEGKSFFVSNSLNVNQAANKSEEVNSKAQIATPIVGNTSTEDYIQIGPHGTLVAKHEFEKVNWRTPSSATRSFLLILFTHNDLATHCLSGKPSPAFIGRQRPTKAQLDPVKIADIVHCVVKHLGCKDKVVKQTITMQCADSAKKVRKCKAANRQR